MDSDTSKTIVKCDKCQHGRWSTDTTPCKGCFPPVEYRAQQIPLTDSEIDEITRQNQRDILARRVRRDRGEKLKKEVKTSESFNEWWQRTHPR